MATIAASSASLADVQSAVNSASDGDTVTIPNGSATWTGGISTTKQIIIRALNYTPTDGGTATRNVSITNNSSSALLSFTTGSTAHCGVAGIKFLEGTGTTNFIRVEGSGSKVILINDCYFQIKPRYGNVEEVAALALLAQGGVLWNCYWDGSDYSEALGNGSYGSNIVVKSPRDWDTASTMGSADTNGNVNLYIEDSTFLQAGITPDVDDNGRIVIRYSSLDGQNGVTHGSTSSYGGRFVEYYNNTFDCTDNLRNVSGRYFWMRGGTGVFTDNEVNTPSTGYGTPILLSVIVENGSRSSPWGHATSYPAIGPEGSGSSHQIGYGHNGSAHVSDPVYVWGNTGAGATAWAMSDTGLTDYSPQYDTDYFVDLNRDIYVSASTAKPSYSKYTYPHPLRGGALLAGPANLRWRPA